FHGHGLVEWIARGCGNLPGKFRNALIEGRGKLEVSVENLQGIDGTGSAGLDGAPLGKNGNAVVADLPETMRSIEYGPRGIQGQRTAADGSVVGVRSSEKIASQLDHLSGREHRITGDGLQQDGEFECHGRRRFKVFAAGKN